MYQETETAGNSYRDEYREGLNLLLKKLQSQSSQNRESQWSKLIDSPNEYRTHIRTSLGWPLTEAQRHPCNIRQEIVTEDEEMLISRIQIEIQPELWMYGIFFQKKAEQRLPVIIAQHGGLGTPEMCSSFFDSENYNDMTVRILKHNVHVFCPQLLLWNAKRFSEGGSDIRLGLDANLKHMGSSIAAIEIDGIQKCIDYLTTLPCVDADRVGMIGLSYGGFYTLHTTALDERIKAALCSCYFNDKTRYNWTDWTWFGSGNTFQDAEVAALIYPRSLWIQITDKDHLFAMDGAVQEFERLQMIIQWPENKLQFEVFPGDHEFGKPDDGIAFVVNALQSKE